MDPDVKMFLFKDKLKGFGMRYCENCKELYSVDDVPHKHECKWNFVLPEDLTPPENEYHSPGHSDVTPDS